MTVLSNTEDKFIENIPEMREVVIPEEPTTLKESTLSKYDGLTENQILKVNIIEETCENKTFEVEMMAGESTAKIYAEKCANSVSKMIEGYRNENNP